MKILFVDDSPEIRMMADDILNRFADEVVICPDVATAKTEYRETFDFIITDFDMPDQTGGDLIKWLIEQGYSRDKIILHSGNPSNKEIAYLFKVKSIDKPEFLNVERLLKEWFSE